MANNSKVKTIKVSKVTKSTYTPEKLLALLGGAHLLEMLNSPQDSELATTEVGEKTKKIILPVGMSKLQAIEELQRIHDNEEQIIEHRCSLDGHDWKDALHAVKKVSEEYFGWINGLTEDSFRGPVRPKELDIIVDIVNDETVTEKCFLGKFTVAAWQDAVIHSFIDPNNGTVGITITAKRRFCEQVTSYFNDVRSYLRTNSIYRGKTVLVTANDREFGTGLDFTIIENKQGDPIVLNPVEQMQIDDFIIPNLQEKGKKSYLFVGDYGNGKSETAMQIGRTANTQGIPFLYVKDPELFGRTLSLAANFEVVCIFMEDLDGIGGGEERGFRMNNLLNTIDGIETKGRNMSFIFTTNHPERLNPAMRRPGRLDQVLEFNNPDVATKHAIFLRYLDGVKGYDTLDYDLLINMVGDVTGSFVAQMAKRCAALGKRRGKITTELAQLAIRSMEPQIKLMNAGIAKKPPIETAFAEIGAALVAPLRADIITIQKQLDRL